MSPYLIPLWKFLKVTEPSTLFWKIYILCNDNNLQSSEIVKKLLEMCIEDQKHVRHLLVDLNTKSQMAIMINKSFRNVYDEKDFHESFSCDLKTNKGSSITVKILRLRKSDVRVFLFYPKGITKTAIIISALSKRSNKLSKAEENYLKNIVDSTVPYWDSTNPLYVDFSSRLI